ncbi:MAG: hypothetical protein WC455_13820 [Dehalococcoidia bacterium]|jgi:hypothetical protein
MRILADRIDNGFHLGADICIHRHGFTRKGGIAGKGDCPAHFHFSLYIAWWYVELSIGKEDPDDR